MMELMTEDEQAALKDGADALRYRATRLRDHSEYEENKPWSEDTANQFEKHAKMLEEIATKAM